MTFCHLLKVVVEVDLVVDSRLRDYSVDLLCIEIYVLLGNAVEKGILNMISNI